MLSHALAATLTLLLLPDWRGVALATLVVLLGFLQWRHRFSGRGKTVVSGIRHDTHGWVLRCGRDAVGSWQRARLLSPVFCHRHLVIVRFQPAQGWLPVTVAVTHDSCDADDFRRLRVLARHLPAPRLWAASR